MALLRKFELLLLADYYQFYLQDETAEGISGNSWTQEASDRMLAVEDDAIGVVTARNTDVPVIIELHDVEPALDDAADRIVEAGMNAPSGKVVVAGCVDYFPEARRVDVEPATYRVRISYANLNSISDDGLDGDDVYRVQLWKSQKKDVKIVRDGKPGRVAE